MTCTKTPQRILYIYGETLKELDGYSKEIGKSRADYLKHILTDGGEVTASGKLEVVPCSHGMSVAGKGFAYVNICGDYLSGVREFCRSLKGYEGDEDDALDFVIRHVAYYDGQTCGGDMGAYVRKQLKVGA